MTTIVEGGKLDFGGEYTMDSSRCDRSSNFIIFNIR
jgi:hypothetical protein